MSGDPKNPSDKDLDLEDWAKEFDVVTGTGPSLAPKEPAQASRPAEEIDPLVHFLDGDFDLLGEGESLGGLLGNSPPELPPPPAMPLPPTPVQVGSSLTDEEIFGFPLDAPFAVGSTPSEDRPIGAGEATFHDETDTAADEFSEATVIAEVAENLLAKTVAETQARKGPALVRREDLLPRAQPNGPAPSPPPPPASEADYEGHEATRIADEGLVRKFITDSTTVPSEEASASEDEEFYDDIQVRVEETTPIPPAVPSVPTRRVSQNIVRRGAISSIAEGPVIEFTADEPELEGPAPVPEALAKLVTAKHDAEPRPSAGEGTALSEAAASPTTELAAPAAPTGQPAPEPTAELELPARDLATLCVSEPPVLDPAGFRFQDAPSDPRGPSVEEDRSALEHYEKEILLARDPQRARILRLESFAVAERLGDHVRAKEHLEEVLALEPGDAPAMRGLRRLCLAQGDLEGALLALDPRTALGEERFARAALRLEILLSMGDEAQARAVHDELYELRPSDVSSRLGAVDLALLGSSDAELATALRDLAQGVEDLPLQSALLVAAGRLLEASSDLPTAREAYLQAHQIVPSDRAALFGLHRAALRSGELRDCARSAGEWASALSGSSLEVAVHRRRGVVHMTLGELPLATSALEQARASAPADPLVLSSLADCLERRDEVRQAAGVLEVLGDVSPTPGRRAHALRHASRLLEKAGDKMGVLATLRRAVAEDPGDLLTAFELVVASIEAGDIEGAVRGLASMGTASGRLRASRLFEQAGRVDDALAVLEAGSDHPAEVEARRRLLAKAGRLEELAKVALGSAEGRLVDFREEQGQWASAARAAERAMRQGAALHLHDQVLHAWRRVLDLDPECSEAHHAIVRLLEASGKGARTEAPEANPTSQVLEALHDAQRAARGREAAASLALRRMALLWEPSTKEPPAPVIEILSELLERDPTSARVHAMLVAALLASNREREAGTQWLSRAQALPEATNTLERAALRFRAAATLMKVEADPARAAVVLEPVIAARPGFVAARELFQRACEATGARTPLAACLGRELEAVRAGQPSSVQHLLSLADRLERHVDDSLGAVEVYELVLGREPSEPLARDGLERNAASAGLWAKLADRALACLSSAEEKADTTAKIRAYEELARVDGEMRGDTVSAVLAWETLASLDPSHPFALRSLESYYTRHGRSAELTQVHEKLRASLATPDDRAAVALEQARLLDLVGSTSSAVTACHEAVVSFEGRPLPHAARMLLFRLEGRTRELGSPEEQATLQESIARYFNWDPRAQAVFLVRAGDALAEVAPAQAISRYRRAAELMPGHLPALRGWRQAALVAEKWDEVAEACEREAALDQVEDRAALYHLAAVVCMDRMRDQDRAIADLRATLAARPNNDDACARLRGLLAATKRHKDLADFLLSRLELGLAPRGVELHMELALLYRDAIGDRASAKAHLSAALAEDPRHLVALAALEDLTWEDHQWPQALEILIARAKLEKDPEVEKRIFLRLGTIYADHVADLRWAMKSFERVLALDPTHKEALERLSLLAVKAEDYRTAVVATERLIAMDHEASAKVTHLHRLARIYQDGLSDRARAEDAFRRAIDVDPTDPRALGGLVDFFSAHRDTVSMRVHLDRVAAKMRERLFRDPADRTAYVVLARALFARARTGIVGSSCAARCAAELALALGEARDEEEGGFLREARGVAQRRFSMGADPAIDDLWFHPGICSGLRQVFHLLAEPLAKRFPVDLRRHGVGKADRLPRSGHAAWDAIGSLAAQFNFSDVDVYISSSHPLAVAVEPSEPPILVLGTRWVHPDRAGELRFVAGMALRLATSTLSIPWRLSPDELGVLIAGIIRQVDPSFATSALPALAIAEEQHRLAKVLPKRLRDEIVPYVAEITGRGFDHLAIHHALLHSGFRAGLVCSGSVQSGIDVISAMRHLGSADVALQDSFAKELCRFAVSDEHAELFRTMMAS
ncbi:MAG: tetratricopeptide repeat protein [Deltaproteobacteria bacterium]|nr:tetratricopeptide repeat protein [Deltaproteobacteria bacterium]